MNDPLDWDWNHPSVVQIRELEAKAHKLSMEIFEALGPGESADLAYNARVSLSKKLAPYRRAMGEQYRKLSGP